MEIAKAYCAHIIGLEVQKITVEVDISNGLHSFSIIGLGDRSVDEARDRIGAAIKNTGYISPKQKNQKVVISLAPADIRKEGTSFDLAMAIAYLKGAGDIDYEHEHILFLGELSLEGNVCSAHGVLPILMQAQRFGFTTAFVPKTNSTEASLAKDVIVYPVDSLRDVIDHLSRKKKLNPIEKKIFSARIIDDQNEYDMSQIRGNESAKRALEIAVAGCHNIALYGPPGTGKTMLAKSTLSIAPYLTYDQAIEVTGIHSVARSLQNELMIMPPFRAPHHTASMISILGGGQQLRPGEVTLAHRGILFMDEFPEFDREIIDGLRQPLEEKYITISRARGSVTFPAQCMLVAAMNPCRCGRNVSMCICSAKSIDQYRKKISGPILDRIDMWIEVNEIDHDKLSARQSEGESSKSIRERVERARKMQTNRFSSGERNRKIHFNSEMNAGEVQNYALLDEQARDILRISSKKIGISGRGFHGVIKVARTIADLEGNEHIHKNHILEALQYRKRGL